MCHQHRTNLLSVGAHEHCSGCTSLHLQKRITTEVTHHPPAWHTSQFWRPWVGHRLFENGLIHGKYSTLVKTPSLQVCGQTGQSETHAFVSGELAGWIEKTRTWQHAVTWISHSPDWARILGVLYIVEHCALPHRKLKPSTSEDVRLFQQTLNPFPEALSILCPGSERVT